MWVRRIAISTIALSAAGGAAKWELDRRVEKQAKALIDDILSPPDEPLELYAWAAKLAVGDQASHWAIPYIGWGNNPKVNRAARHLMAEAKKSGEKLDDLVKAAVEQKTGGPPIDINGGKLAYYRAVMGKDAPPPDDSLSEAYDALAQLVVPTP